MSCSCENGPPVNSTRVTARPPLIKTITTRNRLLRALARFTQKKDARCMSNHNISVLHATLHHPTTFSSGKHPLSRLEPPEDDAPVLVASKNVS
jgi:hypothetical protein